ncbi:3-deoxy-D-manno-octulosonic acid transferase [Allorhodopirellula solitaria]|uniref:3-deoxy-D-manno-octulosonic acid transferase n=1 Tax=Allorhodopirellula solitaria TaxID=2527987 RepID=A0A5C5YG96_9BACT|nr:glycosyltransferase N-terminal domain-containing protein [Allorhodopirellula solitaria]TWT74390.1 3-deoxy-D-manno-octulosonic acid transferase [Allorhodopirellula solitaria]
MFLNVLYATALTLLSPVILYRRVRYGRYRRGASEKLLGLSQQRASELLAGCEESIWLHAVSVGEVNLLPELARLLAIRSPQAAVVISTSTDTGYDLAVKHFGHERVFFCPLDFTWAVRRTLQHLKCHQLVLAELELWPNLISSATRSGCPISVINGRLSKRSSDRYQKFSGRLRSSFASLTAVGCQDEITAERFIACGTEPERTRVTGSLKFDNAPRSRDTPEVAARINWAGVDAWHRVWCFGSTQAGEEAMAIRVYHRLRADHPELRLILVPRHPERFDQVAESIVSASDRVIRRSQNESQFADSWDSDEVILIDTIGELRHWWGVAQIATVGGSFGDRGGQNMLEPAGYGCAVSFGPNTKNFATIADQLIEGRGAVRVADEQELESFVRRCLEDIPAADRLGHAAQEIVDQHRGAYDRTLELLGMRSIPQDAQQDVA